MSVAKWVPGREQSARPELSNVEQALARAQRVLWQTQRPDGSWDGACNLGPITTAQVAVVLSQLKRLTLEDAGQTAKWLRGKQRKDGSFVLYPSAHVGHLGATASAWAAMEMTAPRESAEAIAKARAWVEKQGGIDAVLSLIELGDFSPVFMAIAGLVDPKRIPCPSVAFLVVPPVVKLLQTRFHSGVLMTAFQLWGVVRHLRGELGLPGTEIGLMDSLICRAGIDLLRTFQNDNGSWNNSVVLSTLALAVLPASGMPLTDPMAARALKWMEAQGVRDASGLHFDGFGSEVWATGFDVRALLSSGVNASDSRVTRALSWLVDAQLTRPMPEVDQRVNGAPLTGGWAFQHDNHTMPDCDDAGVVLSALGQALRGGVAAADPALGTRLRASVEKGHAWLKGMQNPDGGWSAYVHGLPGKKPGPMLQKTPRVRMDDPLAMARLLVDPPAPLGDPSTEDVTARVLHGLGMTGLTVEAPEVQRAIGFLQKQQCESGAFWGRWVLNYLSCTAFVLMGLRQVGADLKAPWIRRAVRWVLSKQNADGGWGEGPDSYRVPALAGTGPSMPPLTGLVLTGLLDAGEGGSEEVARGVAYLLSTQRTDGTWPNRNYLHVNIPPDTFFIYNEATRFYPPAALGKYADELRAGGAPVAPRRYGNMQLDAARGQGDPAADAIIRQLYQRGSAGLVGDLMSKVFKSDDPIPDGLPEEARRYFEETDKLPDFADPVKLALAQQLFVRAGWQVAMTLFCSSLPQAYAAAKGSNVLTQTQGMTRHVRQRIFETAQFVFDVADEGALLPSGRGIRAAQKVRLMHAGVRQMLLGRASPAWDTQKEGVPVNQEDLAGTLMTFSVVVVDGLLRLGVAVSPQEQEAWLHLWKVVGHVMGLDPSLMPKDVAEGHELMDVIRDRQWRPSPAGKALIKPLIEMMQEYFPGEWMDGLPVALVRHLAGDACADLLGLPGTDWTGLLLAAGERVESLLSEGSERALARVAADATHKLMAAVVYVEREGKQAKFRLPTALRRTVDPRD